MLPVGQLNHIYYHAMSQLSKSNAFLWGTSLEGAYNKSFLILVLVHLVKKGYNHIERKLKSLKKLWTLFIHILKWSKKLVSVGTFKKIDSHQTGCVNRYQLFCCLPGKFFKPKWGVGDHICEIRRKSCDTWSKTLFHILFRPGQCVSDTYRLFSFVQNS